MHGPLRDRVPAVSNLLRGGALATLVASLALAQSNSTLVCSVPAPTGTPAASGTLNCAPPGGTQTAQTVQFTSEAAVPLNFVLAATPPTLPADIFASVSSGASQIRQFVTLSGNVLTVSFSSVAVGAPLPTPATATTPPGSLLTQVRIQVQSVILADGANPNILFSGTALASNGSGLSPNVFGDITGRTAAVGLAFAGPITFPGLGTTPATATLTTATSAPATMLSVLVTGAFALSSPTGFAALGAPSAAPPTPPPSSGAPVITLAPIPSPTLSTQVSLDASASTNPGGGPLKFSWTAVGNSAAILGSNTATPTIQFPPVKGDYVFQLTVTNSAGVSSTTNITITFAGGF